MKKNKSKLLIFVTLSIAILLSLFSLSFITATQSAVNLGTAGDYVILSKSGISTTGVTSITGDIGSSPIDSTGITGFGLIMDASNQFAKSSLVTGKIYAADYTEPTPTKMTVAVSDMETAYTDAAGRTETSIVTELGAGDISGMTLKPGLYKWGTGLLINNDVTLSGSSNDVWIFQVAQDLNVGNGAIITLAGGAQAKNIFWQVGGQATLETTSNFKGNILSQTMIEINNGAVLNGRALAQTAVTLDANTITLPSGDSSNLNSDFSLNENSATLNSGDVKVKTEIPTEIKNNTIRVTQSNGINADIKIMPSVASETAIAKLGLKFCTAENNCTITLKEVGNGADAKIVYQVRAQKDVKVIGLFRAKMNVEANVDAKTNEIISTHVPWWNKISTNAS